MNYALIWPGLVLLMAINGYRADSGLQPLSYSYDTCQLAVERLEDLPTEWSHKGFFRRIGNENFDGGYWAENLGREHLSAEQVLLEWKLSALHNWNLLAPEMNEACIATDGEYWVLEMHKRT